MLQRLQCYAEEKPLSIAYTITDTALAASDGKPGRLCDGAAVVRLQMSRKLVLLDELRLLHIVRSELHLLLVLCTWWRCRCAWHWHSRD